MREARNSALASSSSESYDVEDEVATLRARLAASELRCAVQRREMMKMASVLGGAVGMASGMSSGALKAMEGEAAMEAVRLGEAAGPSVTQAVEAEVSQAAGLCLELLQDLMRRGESLEVLANLKRAAMDQLTEGLTIADFTRPDQPLIYVNEGFMRATGYSVSETLGRNCRFLQGPNPSAETRREVARLREAVGKGERVKVELENFRKDGTPFINALSLTPIHNEAGALTHYVGIQSDITDFREQQRAQVAARKEAAAAAAATEAKSQFLANMSHEIRTPLNGMLAVGEMLSMSELTPAQRDLVDTITSSGHMLRTLVSDILDFSRIEANKLELRWESFDLRKTVDAAVNMVGLISVQRHLNVAYYIEEGTPSHVYGDPNRVHQVLLNLLNNAVKFTERGDVVVQVSARPCEPSPWPHASMHRGGGAAVAQGGTWHELNFEVRDSGVGLDKEGLAKLFATFSQVDNTPTRKYGGTGLGLAISKLLAECMCGTTWAHSEGLGRGSSFHFMMRCTDDPTRATAPPPALCKRVLVVDPSRVVRQTLAAALYAQGIDVVSLATESDAMALLGLPGGQLGAGATGVLGDELANLDTSYLNIESPALREDDRRRLALSRAGPPSALLEPHTRFDLVILDSGFEALEKKLRELSNPNLENPLRVITLGWPDLSAKIPPGQTVLVNKHGAQRQPSVSVPVEPFVWNLSKPTQHQQLARVITAAFQQSRGSQARKSVDMMEEDDDEGGESSRSLSVMIAEDNAINMKVASSILTKLGHKITSCWDGVDVLETLERDRGIAAFDYILMDLHMPRMGGMEATRKIRQQWPDSSIKVIAVTADAFEEVRSACLGNGFDGWLAKPFGVTELKNIFKTHMVKGGKRGFHATAV